ncbi:conserved hypothetical protein [Candidatus Methylobacter favarea]|uniref:Uncharacterized protein n=1 Tax=Candidatus Methylobacter favarea TaxID=2707345 RepID=A0A8S0WYH7_9GAMM|nr:class I SAM-dependent methyltransferase [Candidatus Methylobacter favarea]CAA9889563.1 conserved hypothetical protein [Candidatus Methylobacter favarea]
MDNILIWGYSVPSTWLSQAETDYLKGLPQELPTVEWVWEEMDRVWHELNLDNRRPFASQNIGDYYGHPVWLMNGIFTALDPVSFSHRIAISNHLKLLGVKSIADYGGGFGELARAMCHAIPDAVVSIVEPYPSRVGLERLRNEPRIRFVSDLSASGYDAIIAQDVLEHLEDPLFLAYQIANAVTEEGRLIFANCFYPVIQCHLPSTYHFRHTFPWVMESLGLRYLGTVEGASHALVFKRVGRLNLARARRAETVSRLFGQPFNQVHMSLSRIKSLVLRS